MKLASPSVANSVAARNNLPSDGATAETFPFFQIHGRGKGRLASDFQLEGLASVLVGGGSNFPQGDQ